MKPSISPLFIALALLGRAPNLAIAAVGDLYAANFGTNSVLRFTPAGAKSTFASNLPNVFGVAFDHSGNLFAAVQSSIIKITPMGDQSTFASSLNLPQSLAVDSAGNLFVAEFGANTILKFTPAGAKTPFATGLNKSTGLAFDNAGNLFASDLGTGVIFKFTPSGVKSTFVMGLSSPQGLVFDRFGNLFVANGETDSVEKFTPGGTRTTFATGIVGVQGLAFDATGNLFVSDGNTNAIYKFTPSGVKTTFTAGLANPGYLAVEPARDLSLNISTRLRVQTGENVLIGGFIVTGTQPKRVIVRAIGPSLRLSGVPDALQDPVLEMFNSAGALFFTNDNWKDSQPAEIEATGVAPSDARESAALLMLPPGNYTAGVRGKNNATGIGLVEVYDLDQAANSKLANISTRGFVETGDNVMIGGFILGGGNGAGKIILRALGPSLTQSGVASALADPVLELRDGSGTLVSKNDDWKATQQAELQATGIPPTNDRESAIVTTLPSGNYTTLVKGFNDGTGVGLVEIYNLR